MEKRGERWKEVEFSVGQTQIKVDEKGRISLPTQAHDLLSDQSLVLSLAVYQKRVFLELLSSKEWELRVSNLEKLPQNHPKTKAIKRFVLSGSVKVSVDKQNRVTIPMHQREALGLLREAIVINLDNKFELWSLERWKETFESLVDGAEDLESWAYGIDDQGEQQEEQDELKSAA